MRSTIACGVMTLIGLGLWSGAAQAQTPVVWTNVVRADTPGAQQNGLHKNAGCGGCQDSGANAAASLSGDGYFEFTTPDSTSELVIGLTSDPTGTTWANITWSIRLNGGYADVFEGGVYRGEWPIAAGDTFRFTVSAGHVTYTRNGGAPITPNAVTVTSPLTLDVSLLALNASIANAMWSGGPPPPGTSPVTWLEKTRVNTLGLSANGLIKVSGCQGCQDAGAYSQQQITPTGGYFQFKAPDTTTEAMIGLTTAPSGTTWANIKWAIELSGGIAMVFENGGYQGEWALAAGDTFRITVSGGHVTYTRNGGSPITPNVATLAYPLTFDTSMLSLNGSITDAVFSGDAVGGPPDGAPQTYNLRTDSAVIGTGPATPPAIGAAGQSVVDSEFGTRITRVTDTASSADGRSWGTPSAPNLNMIGSDDRKFYAMSDDGSTVLIYDFDPATGAFSFNHQTFFLGEPTFSRKIEKPNIMYAPHYGYTVVSYDVNTRTLSAPLITLTDEVGPMNADTQFVSVVYSSQGSPERIAVSYGGIQNTHHYMTVFDADNPANRITIDTRTSQMRVNGGAWQALLKPDGTLANINFGLHSIAIDRSGKWVKLDLPGNEGGAGHTALFNVETRRVHEWTSNAWFGHYALGWDAHVSCIADPNGGGTYQWLFTDLTQPGLPPPWRALIAPPPPGNDQQNSDHTSWNNARLDAFVPVISGTQRNVGSLQWDRWDNEILAVATQVNAPAQVYRAGRHYMAFVDQNGNVVGTFRDSPRPQVTHNGMWTFFTSNWGVTLGSDSGGHRRDLFVVRMARE